MHTHVCWCWTCCRRENPVLKITEVLLHVLGNFLGSVGPNSLNNEFFEYSCKAFLGFQNSSGSSSWFLSGRWNIWRIERKDLHNNMIGTQDKDRRSTQNAKRRGKNAAYTRVGTVLLAPKLICGPIWYLHFSMHTSLAMGGFERANRTQSSVWIRNTKFNFIWVDL